MSAIHESISSNDILKLIQDCGGLVVVHLDAKVSVLREAIQILSDAGYPGAEKFYLHFSHESSPFYDRAVKVAREILARANERFQGRVELGKFIDMTHVDRIEFCLTGKRYRWFERGSIFPAGIELV